MTAQATDLTVRVRDRLVGSAASTGTGPGDASLHDRISALVREEAAKSFRHIRVFSM